MKLIHNIKTYQANRTRVSAKDVNDIVKRLEYLERMQAISPLKINHLNEIPIISLNYTPAVIFRFQLLNDLQIYPAVNATYKTAQARYVVYKSDTDEFIRDDNDKIIEVWDALNIHSGLENENGYCIHTPEVNRFEILKIQNIARWVRFKLNEDLTTSMSKAQAIIMDYWQGYSPEERFGNDFEVWNIPATNSPYIFFGESAGQGGGTSGSSGDIGLAVWDDIEKVYKIVNIECA
jgi:hypothetical protein